MKKNQNKNEISKNKLQKLSYYFVKPENRKIWIFLLSFSILIISFYTFSALGYLNWANDLLARIGVQVSSTILIQIFPILIIENNSIMLEHFRVNVNAGCDGLEVISLFIIAVVSFPVSFKKKYLVLLFGSLIIFILNILRIIALFYIGYKYNEYLDLFHHDIFPVFFIIIEFLMWSYWINCATKDKVLLTENNLNLM